MDDWQIIAKVGAIMNRAIDPVNADINRMHGQEDDARQEYQTRPDVEMNDVIEAIGKERINAVLWEGLGPDGVCDDDAQAVELLGYFENYDFEAIGRAMYNQGVAYFVGVAQDKLAARGEFKTDTEDMLSALGVTS